MNKRSLNIVSNSKKKEAELLKPNEFKGRAAVVTLGCAKNQVDSEVILGTLMKFGFEVVNEVENADLAVINTCGFLQSAVEESVDCILDVSELKKTGQLRKLIVTGCMLPRYGKDLAETMPEVDVFLSPNDLTDISKFGIEKDEATKVFQDASRPYFLYDDSLPRVLSTKSHTSYVKISEGCNRPCAFCIIPKIRGGMRSRSIESIVSEIKDLKDLGTKEVNLIAQDLTSFGKDTKKGDLTKLLQEIDKTGIDWTRLLYAYPVGATDELLTNIVNLKSMVNYLDIPLQHMSEAVLKSMKRPLGKLHPRVLTEHMRKKFPEIVIRTTFIVGFPGETEADVKELESVVAEGHYGSVGVFEYSQEEGTPAGAMENQISDEVKKERKERVMLAQQNAISKINKDYIGKRFKVLLEGTHSDTDLLLTGRTPFQAPDVDGMVLINDLGDFDANDVKNGNFYEVEITDSVDYDLVGKLV